MIEKRILKIHNRTNFVILFYVVILMLNKKNVQSFLLLKRKTNEKFEVSFIFQFISQSYILNSIYSHIILHFFILFSCFIFQLTDVKKFICTVARQSGANKQVI